MDNLFINSDLENLVAIISFTFLIVATMVALSSNYSKCVKFGIPFRLTHINIQDYFDVFLLSFAILLFGIIAPVYFVILLDLSNGIEIFFIFYMIMLLFTLTILLLCQLHKISYSNKINLIILLGASFVLTVLCAFTYVFFGEYTITLVFIYAFIIFAIYIFGVVFKISGSSDDYILLKVEKDYFIGVMRINSNEWIMIPCKKTKSPYKKSIFSKFKKTIIKEIYVFEKNKFLIKTLNGTLERITGNDIEWNSSNK